MGAQVPSPQPMLAATIPAYPYRQYADDDDIQAFFAAYNAATQTYVDWFNSVNLPFYPSLSAPLLDWVLNGLYGTQRTSLTQSASAAAGPLNTEELNTATLNSFTAPTTTYYSISDDVLKRILTWNFYKGDGKRFTMKWLKRRIMRFLTGTNGLNPNPLDPSFVVGPENTQAVSVTVASDVLTVTVNGAAISSLVQLQPNVLPILRAAFLGGILEIPVQYTLAFNIVTTLVATASPSSESVTGIATTLSTGTASVSAVGGTGALSYTWTWSSGGTGITINSPSAADTSFTASGITRGTTLTGTAKCTVSDGTHTAYAYVTVSIRNVSAPALSISPSSLSGVTASSSFTTGGATATATGGGTEASVSWTWQSGGAGIFIDSPSALTTAFSASGLGYGQTVSGTALCTYTDSYGQTATGTCAVSIQRATQLTAVTSPGSLSASSGSTPITTGGTTVTPSGGEPPYTYFWTYGWNTNTDGASGSIGSPSSATTNFTASGMSAGTTDTGTGTCTVTDSLGQHAYPTVAVSFQYLPPTQHTYASGSGTETVPAGYTTVVIETWGGGGGGGGGTGNLCTGTPGSSGGGSGYSRSSYACSGGQTLSYVVGTAGANGGSHEADGNPGGTSTVSSGSLAITTLTATGGGGGQGDGAGAPGTGGAGGTGSGGNQANATGESGTTGALPQTGIFANTTASTSMNGAGGSGNFNSGNAGKAGLISFRYS